MDHRTNRFNLKEASKGNKGKRKEIYLQWMKEKEEKRIAEMKVKKGLQKKKVCKVELTGISGPRTSQKTEFGHGGPESKAYNSVCEFIRLFIPLYFIIFKEMEDREAAEEKARERKAVRDGWELAKKQKEKSFQ